MSDNEFIDKLNDILFNYGYIIIDRTNYEYYLDRYKLKNYCKVYLDDRHFDRFQLFNIKENVLKLDFNSIHDMIDSPWSIFEYTENYMYEYRYIGGDLIKLFSIEFCNFMMSIKGNSKEEIILKIQMMGY